LLSHDGVVLGRIAIAGLAIIVFVAIAAVSAEAAAFVFVGGLVIVLPGLSYIDAINVPKECWNATGQSRTVWTVSFFIFPFGIGMLATVAYWTWLRRRLPGGALKRGETVDITTGLHAGREAKLSHRYMLGLAGVWVATVRLDDGSTTNVQVWTNMVRRRSDVAAS